MKKRKEKEKEERGIAMGDDLSYGLNTLGPLCLWQFFICNQPTPKASCTKRHYEGVFIFPSFVKVK